MIFCVECGADLRGKYCWRCGVASDARVTEVIAPQPRTISLGGVASVAVATIGGVLLFVFPPLGILASLGWVVYLILREVRSNQAGTVATSPD